MSERYRIAEWSFAPESHELTRGGKTVKLEHRTARALELLCERRGEIVSQAEISAVLWGTRQVSGNSLAVVIRDLRRAFGDDARAPRFVETVAKGGYRLIAADDAPVVTAPMPTAAIRRRPLFAAMAAVGALIALGGAGAVALNWRDSPTRVLVLIEPIRNETGDPRYDALSKASGEIIVTDLSRYDRLRVVRTGAVSTSSAAHAVRLNAKLVLWSGKPDVVMVAEDAQSATVLWSDYAFGEENTLPGKVNTRLAGFVQKTAGFSRGR